MINMVDPIVISCPLGDDIYKCPKCDHVIETLKWARSHIDGYLCKWRIFHKEMDSKRWIILSNKYKRTVIQSGVPHELRTVGRATRTVIGYRKGESVIAVPQHIKDMINLYEEGLLGYAGLNLKSVLSKSYGNEASNQDYEKS